MGKALPQLPLMSQNTNSQEHLRSLSAFSSRLEDRLSRILLKLEGTNYDALEKFKPIVKPKKNIEALRDFYERYSRAVKTREDIMLEISRTKIGDLKTDRRIKLGELNEIKIIEKLRKLMELERDLREYQAVRIVSLYGEETRCYIEKVMRIVKASFFSALSRLPSIPDSSAEYASFILENSDNREFLGTYVKKAYDALTLPANNMERDKLVFWTRNLTKYFELIINLNIKILGQKAAHNINVGLITQIVLNLRTVIRDRLAEIEQVNDPETIPFLVSLRKNIRHSPGPKIKEIELLFVFKPQIDKLVLNCFIQFFADLERLSAPEKNYGAEPLCLTMSKALDAFASSKKFSESWISAYGPSFGVYTPESLGNNFGEKCLLKVQRLSKKLRNFPLYVYLINNYYVLAPHTRTCGSHTVEELIKSNSEFILGLWKIKMEKISSGSELNRFLKDELPAHTKYRLPSRARREIQRKLREHVDMLVAENGWSGLQTLTREMLDVVYRG